jgi:transitional endoplasmic reticulum ATPase
VIHYKPDFAEAYYILGLAYQYMDELDKAIEQYNEAIKRNPDFTDAKNKLELCESKKKNRRETIQSKPNACDYSEVLKEISSLEKQGNYSDALMNIEEKRKKAPDDFTLLLAKRIIVEKLRLKESEVVFGLEELEDTFDRLVICPLRYADDPLYQVPIVQASKGIMLHGPPGCGKNLFVRYITRKAEITLIEIVLSDVLSMWCGESEKRLTAIFEKAIEMARGGTLVMLFIDELDALGFARGLTPAQDEAEYRRHFQATFLRLFNEVEKIPNIIVIGATNCFWAVDGALKRPGRMGSAIIYVPPPDEKTRESMFRYFSKDTPGHESLNFKKLRTMSQSMSGADISAVCRDVHLEIAREIVKNKRKGIKAKTSDYEWYIDKRVPQTLCWMRKVSKAWKKGQIEDYELDRRLLEDINRVNTMDIRFKRAKRKK